MKSPSPTPEPREPSVPLTTRDALLEAAPFFAALPSSIRSRLCGAMVERRFEVGEAMVIEGEPAGTMFLIAEGSALVSGLRNASPVTLGKLSPGSVFGQEALIGQGVPERDTLTAASAGLALTLDRASFASIVNRDPASLRQVATQVPGAPRGARLHLRFLYRLHFHDVRRELLFLSSVSFFVTFLSVRTIVHLIRSGKGPFHNVTSKSGTHIHHLVWGILLLLLVGYLWLFQTDRAGKDRAIIRANAILYGIGGALTLDEFALWLKLADVYFTPQGEESVRAVFAFGSLLSIGVWGRPFLREVSRFLLHPLRRSPL